jgi:hypothetical protein
MPSWTRAMIENACVPRAYLCVFRVVAHRRISRRGMAFARERFSRASLLRGTQSTNHDQGSYTQRHRDIYVAEHRVASSHPCARRWTARTPPRRRRPRRSARRRTARRRSVRARGCVTACSRLMIDERVNEKYRCVLCFARARVGTRLTCRRRRA